VDISVVDSTAFVGGYSLITLDSDGWVHISYYDYYNDSLNYATFSIISIPEFSGLMLPALGLMCMFLLVSARGRSRRTLPES
jgi:hypothetical protein